MNFNLVHEENDDNGNFKAIDMEKIDLEQNNKNYQSFDEKDSNTNFTSKNSIVPEVPNKEDTNKDKETEEQRISYNTLHEPIQMTLLRDLSRIGFKLKHVLSPYIKDEERSKQLRNWDLWGPLVFNILLAVTLSFNNGDKGSLFVLVFTIFWFGGVVIAFNAQMLGAKISILQSLCLLGYCMFPLNLVALIFAFLSVHEFIKVLLIILCCVWSSYSSVGFLKDIVMERKKVLVLYPVILFYLFLSWFILMNH